MSAEAIEIDGSVLEGGGQILRMAFSLSVLTRKPIKVTKIRAGRSTPGLRPQHKSGADLIRDISNGKIWGAQVGSEEIKFHPGKLVGGPYTADTQTAGSIALLIQVALPCALFSPTPVQLKLRGGTNADMAPQIDYISVVFKRVLEKFGASFDCNIKKRGYFPRGGGEVLLQTQPVKSLKAVQMLDPGHVVKVWGSAFVAGTLPRSIADNTASEALKRLRSSLPGVNIDLHGYKENVEYAVGNGTGINVFAETSTGCIFGGSALGKRHVSAAEVAAGAVNELLSSINSKVCVDGHSQDQVILLMALAAGRSSIKCGPITLHTQTAIHIAQILTAAKFNVENLGDDTNIIHCDGIGYQHDESVPME